MTTVEACSRCGLPVFPNASESVKASGLVCLCGMPRTAHRGDTQTPFRPKGDLMPVEQKTAQGKAVPDLEQLYLDLLAEHAPDLPKPLRQQELIPGRKFTTDFCWPGQMLAVEIEGACHRTEDRFYSDAEKQNLLVMEGWKVLRFTGRMLRGRVTDVVFWTREGLRRWNR